MLTASLAGQPALRLARPAGHGDLDLLLGEDGRGVDLLLLRVRGGRGEAGGDNEKQESREADGDAE